MRKLGMCLHSLETLGDVSLPTFSTVAERTCARSGLVGSCHGLQVLGSGAGLPGRQPGSQGRQALQEWQQLCALLHAFQAT